MNEYTTPKSAHSDQPSTGRDADRERIEAAARKRELDRRLDQALEDTFPASDPVSIVVPVR